MANKPRLGTVTTQITIDEVKLQNSRKNIEVCLKSKVKKFNSGGGYIPTSQNYAGKDVIILILKWWQKSKKQELSWILHIFALF